MRERAEPQNQPASQPFRMQIAARWRQFARKTRRHGIDLGLYGVSQKDRTKNISEIGRVGLVKNAEIPVSDLFEKHRTRFCPSENTTTHTWFGSCKNATERFPWVGSAWWFGSRLRYTVFYGSGVGFPLAFQKAASQLSPFRKHYHSQSVSVATE